MDAKTQDISNRLYNLDVYNAWDNDETIETIVETIKNEPLTVINYLLDMIEG